MHDYGRKIVIYIEQQSHVRHSWFFNVQWKKLNWERPRVYGSGVSVWMRRGKIFLNIPQVSKRNLLYAACITHSTLSLNFLSPYTHHFCLLTIRESERAMNIKTAHKLLNFFNFILYFIVKIHTRHTASWVVLGPR